MSEIIKIIHEREKQKQNKKKKVNKDRKEQGGTKAIMKGCDPNDIVVYLS